MAVDAAAVPVGDSRHPDEVSESSRFGTSLVVPDSAGGGRREGGRRPGVGRVRRFGSLLEPLDVSPTEVVERLGSRPGPPSRLWVFRDLRSTEGADVYGASVVAPPAGGGHGGSRDALVPG